ncbi:transporter, partial [Methylobacterium sp. DB1607]|nr:transporter [Methylobacterium sp. DB1607]
MSRLALYTAILGIALMASDPVAGASDTAPVDAGPTTEAALGERMNANTVTVVTGTPGGTYFRVGAELAFVLDDG